jgi:hypothetical protein
MFSIGLGLFIVSAQNLSVGILQAFLILTGIFMTVYSYCAKCPARNSECGHPQIGLLRWFVPKRQKGEYSFFDCIGIFLFIVPAFLLPQFWLWGNWKAFGLFWGLILFSGIIVLWKFCKNCPNRYCKMNRCP